MVFCITRAWGGGGYENITIPFSASLPIRTFGSLNQFPPSDHLGYGVTRMPRPGFGNGWVKGLNSNIGWISGLRYDRTRTERRVATKESMFPRPDTPTITGMNVSLDGDYITGPSFRNPGFGNTKKIATYIIRTNAPFSILRIHDTHASHEESDEIRISDGEGYCYYSSWGTLPTHCKHLFYGNWSNVRGQYDPGNTKDSNESRTSAINVLVFNYQGVYHGTRGPSKIMPKVRNQFPIRIVDPYDGKTYTYNY